MAALVKTAYDGYRHIFYEWADPRVTDWFLVGSPMYPLGLLALYLYIVKVAGPRYMNNRPAYQLTGIISLYNAMQIVLNALLFLKGLKVAKTGYTYCLAVEYSYAPEVMFWAECAWDYYMLKMLDLMDTIFFVLRKKYSQVTTLHVYHHIMMALGTWLFLKMGSGRHELTLGLMNTFVHVCMYSYYFVTNIRPEYKKNIWWKKHITQLQMVQFAINLVYYLSGLIVPNCQYPTGFSIIITLQNLIFFLMFYDFYRKTYRKQKHT